MYKIFWIEHSSYRKGNYIKMKNKKMKLLSCILAFIMLIPMLCSFSVNASNDPVISAGNAQGKLGDKIEVPLYIDNNPGVISLFISINYNRDVLKLVGVSDTGTVLADPLHSGTLEWYPFNMSWMMLGAPGVNNTKNGFMATLNFEIIGNAVEGSTDIVITYSEGNITNAKNENVSFTMQSGKVTILSASEIPSDTTPVTPPSARKKGFITNNGNNTDITAADLNAIFLHLKSQKQLTETDLLAADVNGINGVDFHDAIYIARYLSKKITMNTLQSAHAQ